MATIKTNKPKTPRTSTKAAMPLKKKFRVNKWAALGVVAVLAGVGYFMVKNSQASNYTFELYANNRELQGGQIDNKSGTAYRVTDLPNYVELAPLAFPANTKQVCSHVKSYDATITLYITVKFNWVNSSPGYAQGNGLTLRKNQTGNVCAGTRTSDALRSFEAHVQTTTAARGKRFGVSSFYGLPY